MPRESKKVKVERGIELCRRMHELYPSVQSALDYHDAFTLLISVMLSAQTTDAAVNKVGQTRLPWRQQMLLRSGRSTIPLVSGVLKPSIAWKLRKSC